MELQLINVELTEARLFNRSRRFAMFTGKNISDLVYLHTLSLYMTYLMPETREFAKQYAHLTSQYNTYSLFRTYSTDLYMLCYQILHPDNDHAIIDDPVVSKKFLQSLNFDRKMHLRVLRNIASGDVTDSMITTFFYRLETQLKISDSRYKTWRREILNWSAMSSAKKDQIIRDLQRELKRVSKNSVMGSEIFSSLGVNTKRVRDPIKSKQQDTKPSTTKRALATVAGATVGAYAGKKIAQKLNKDTDKYKKAGAGIGAVAGYWASGRKSKS